MQPTLRNIEDHGVSDELALSLSIGPNFDFEMQARLNDKRLTLEFKNVAVMEKFIAKMNDLLFRAKLYKWDNRIGFTVNSKEGI